MEQQRCHHDMKESENKLVCVKCNKSELLLRETDNDGLRIGTKVDGKKYLVRDSRNKYFFPEEWLSFIKHVSPSKKIFFETLIMTGARIQEVMMIKKRHIQFDRNFIVLYTTKVKAKKQERKSKERNVSISKRFTRKIKSYTLGMDDNDYIFLNNDKCKDKTEKEVKNIAHKKGMNVYQIFKRTLNKTEIEDTYNYSLHNIRKTHGMWLTTLGIQLNEICQRLGHDANTYIKHYGSTDIFSNRDKKMIIEILGDIYGFK
jgi:integrase